MQSTSRLRNWDVFAARAGRENGGRCPSYKIQVNCVAPRLIPLADFVIPSREPTEHMETEVME